jgi:hypothetical protein
LTAPGPWFYAGHDAPPQGQSLSLSDNTWTIAELP